MLTIFKNKTFLINLSYQASAVLNVRLLSSPSSLKEDNRYYIYNKLNPYIDFEERIKSTGLRNSIIKRNLKINLEHIYQLWKQYKAIEETKLKLEQSKIEIAEKIKSYTDTEKYKNEISGLKIAGKVIRQDIKNVFSTLSDLERSLLKQVITLPNDLRDELFPNEIKLFSSPRQCNEHHLKIGKQLNLVEYISPAAYFLKGDAAVFELDVTSYFADFIRKCGFIPVSNPDFSRDLIIEGSCVNTDSILKLERDKRADDLFLNGSASLFPFYSYHTRHISSYIPVKYIAHGRHYQKYDFEDGLYSVWQNSAIQVFVASSESKILEEIERTIQIITSLYQKLGLHFRIKKVPAPELELFESIRLSFQIHSPFRNDFIEVGNLSFHSDYISKRLRIYHKDSKNNSFMHCLSGTVLKIGPLLASYLEHNKSCKLPTSLLK